MSNLAIVEATRGERTQLARTMIPLLDIGIILTSRS